MLASALPSWKTFWYGDISTHGLTVRGYYVMQAVRICAGKRIPIVAFGGNAKFSIKRRLGYGGR